MRMIFNEWDRFCASLDVAKCVTVSELPHVAGDMKWIAIKHDVETNVERALTIARIEAAHGIKATFFVQSYLLKDNVKFLRAIADLGHEVTYHYDVLDSNNGDFELAIREFAETVGEFERLGFGVTSVCPHGNPMMIRSGWNSNKDFFRDEVVASKFSAIFDLVVQGKDKIKRDYSYVSDAGYGFKIISDIGNNDLHPCQDVSLSSVDELIEQAARCSAIVISTHPHRWFDNIASAVFARFRFLALRKIATLASKSNICRRLMSRFYFLAKKI